MGAEDKSTYFGKNLKNRGTIFTLGSRDTVLTPSGLIQDILVPHTAGKDGTKVCVNKLYIDDTILMILNFASVSIWGSIS